MRKSKTIAIIGVLFICSILVIVVYFQSIRPNSSNTEGIPLSNNNVELKIHPVVKVTNIVLNNNNLNYKEIHKSFAHNYSGMDMSIDLRDTLVKDMMKQSKDLGENEIILLKAIYSTYNDWSKRPYDIPCYAEKAYYKNVSVWGLAFNRANGFDEGNAAHFDVYYISIPYLEKMSYSGCNSTAILYRYCCH